MRVSTSRASPGSSRTCTAAACSLARRACAAGSTATSARRTISARANASPFPMRRSVAQAGGDELSLAGLGRVARAHANVEVAQLLFRDGARGTDQEVLAALRLRKSDHVADLLDPRHQRYGAVEA